MNAYIEKINGFLKAQPKDSRFAEPESILQMLQYYYRQRGLTKKRNEKIAFILPVGPMGMYKWVVYFLKELADPLVAECN